jgi:hemerythrin-like domain-containing protein
MSKISDILMDEHKNILKVIDFLLIECDNVEQGKDIDKDFFKKTIDFIRNYADKFHHAKEEDLLFKEMCSDNVSEKLHCNPIEQMLHEHDLGRDFVRGIEEGVEEGNKEKVLENARGYAQLLQEHIFKEDNILYPMAEEAFSEDIKEKMIKKFLEIENEKKNDKNKYESFARELS